MKKISIKSAEALLNGKNLKIDNTVVKDNAMYLYNNKIAWIEDDKIYFSLCGWNTPTTRDRLNALGVMVYQKNFEAYLGKEKIDSEKVYCQNL